MQKLLIANRGAIARRIIRACADEGIRSVAVYSDADAQAPYLDEADEAFALDGLSPADTYLNQSALLNIARQCNADSVHPGYGFLAENAVFAQSVIEQEMVFVGPDPAWLEIMGNKVTARKLMQENGYPIFPGSELLQDIDSALAVAQHIGYPILVKPSGGGGGMGMELVAKESDLGHAIGRAKAVARNAFADAGVYLEKWIAQPRHIEYQILGDGCGNAIHAFERECSVQRRNQKLIEESPAPGIDREVLLRRAQQAADVCANIGYNNVGTVETLLARDGSFGFLEMNTRIQVEHGVTEAVTGLDLVRQQLSLARGGQLPEQVCASGFAIEARIYAEDSITMLPSTGRLTVFRPPNLFGVRVETGYQEGQIITPYYDAMLAKIIAYADTREKAIGRLFIALKAFEIQGLQTNQALLQRVLQDSDFLAGRVDTGLLNRVLVKSSPGES
ncbi:MAG: ATP-grasp domain-containing protein [Gammaproteobacteria bacterium]|nr:ATP-grasp domain-containing protein [Gammaproteobacteria bacterium]